MANLPQTLAIEIRRALRQPDEANVHDLRVAIRRFNQALVLDVRNGRRSLERRLKKTMRAAGEVRNADITLELVAKLKRTRSLQRLIHRRRGKSAAGLIQALKRWNPAQIPQQLPAPTPASAHAVVRAARRLFKRAAKSGDAQRLHRIRIAAKKLRYTLELVAPDHPRMEAIKQLQSMLGRINDFETAQTIVQEEAKSKPVCDQLARKQARRIQEFHRYWAALFPDPATQREWIREFTAIHSRNVSE
jgi:CHAD domain-containing protein